MILTAIISFFIGAALAAGFRVWVLIPAMMCVLTLVVVLSWITVMDVSSLVGGWLASVVSLQLGYFLGALRSRPESSHRRAVSVGANFVSRDHQAF
jgi:hypothetical protein